MEDFLAQLFAGLVGLARPDVFLFLMIGIVVGMFFGLVPGLSGLSGMALLLPFSIGHPPETAFPFLLGMFAATVQTDTIPAVLIGVPGTAAAQACCIDGFPMAKRGEAGRALSAAHFSAIMGSVVALGIFILFLPLLRRLVDQFGAAEYFMLAMLGLIMAGSLSGTSVLRGLMSACLGLMVSMVGFAPNTDFPRFDFFGWTYLWDGVPIVPIILGLFAIPEVIELMLRQSSISRAKWDTSGGIYQGIYDTLREHWLVLRCGTIGTVCGMIPGLGGVIAEWFAYGHAVTSAKDRSMFGRGDVRGVIAPESSSSAQKAGAILPTVAFGIPGNPGMAIMMGAFLITGLRPGPDMLTDKLNITFLMVWTVVVANVIGALLCLGVQRWMIRICYLRASILAPIILAFMAVGASLATSDLGDIVTFGLFGAVGYLFKRTDWPRVPLIIGFVLGTLAERYLFIAVDRYGATWLWQRPIVVIIEALMILAIAYPAYSRLARRKGASVAASSAGDLAEDVVHPALQSATWWLGIALAGIVAYSTYVASHWLLGGRLFPWIIGFTFLAVAFVHSLLGLTRGTRSIVEIEMNGDYPVTSLERIRILSSIGAFLIMVTLVGHLVAVPLCILLFMWTQGERFWLSAMIAFAVGIFVYIGLVRIIHVNLPVPLLDVWLSRLVL